jgi:tRNA(adenine34) deaminase
VTSDYLAAFEPAMRLALAGAADSARNSAGGAGHDDDVPVGAVVLASDGEVIGSGRNRVVADRDPTAHAEIVAIRAAAAALGRWRLDECTLVVTLEPCPMCAGAVISARIGRLVYGAPDPRAGAVGSVWDVIRDRRLSRGVEVIGGVLADECAALLREFFRQLRPPAG